MDRGRTGLDGVARRLAQPELLLVVMAFAFHTTWEFLQDPLYAGLATRVHAEVRSICLKAAAGDVGITLVAFSAAALVARSRLWFVRPSLAAVAAWFLTGVAITLALEGRATAGGAWIPLLRVGLAPLAQWIAVPAILLAFIQLCFSGAGCLERKTS
jgi:hypothetical protein